MREVRKYKSDWEASVAEMRSIARQTTKAIAHPAMKRVLSEIESIQSEGATLGAELARSLAIATDIGDAEAAAFCRRELEGWTQENKAAFRAAGNLPHHRQVVAYGSLIDLKEMEGFGDPAKLWSYMSKAADLFIEYTFFISISVREIEDVIRNAEGEQIVSLKLQIGELPGDYSNPDAPFFLYSKASALRRVLTKTGSELSSVLMKMLERLS